MSAAEEDLAEEGDEPDGVDTLERPEPEAAPGMYTEADTETEAEGPEAPGARVV